MENTALSIIENANLQQISATIQKITQFQTIIQSTLKSGHDYGVIPGTKKPTLLKPGAEKILMLMGLTSEYEVTEKIQDYDNGFFAFTVKCLLSRNGIKVTEGLGHANTKEGRYSKRWVTEKNLPEGIEKKGLPSREKEGKYGKYTEYQVGNDDPYTLANTVLKMAKKRAQVDASLTVASLSEIFTQDIEDTEIIEEVPFKQQTRQTYNQQTVKPAQQTQSDPNVISSAQASRLFTIASGNDELVRKALNEFNYVSTKDIKKEHYEVIESYIKSLMKKKTEEEKTNE